MSSKQTNTNNQSTDILLNFGVEDDESWVDCLANDVLYDIDMDMGNTTYYRYSNYSLHMFANSITHILCLLLSHRDDSDQFSFASEDRPATFNNQEEYHVEHNKRPLAGYYYHGSTGDSVQSDEHQDHKRLKASHGTTSALTKAQQQKQFFFQFVKLITLQDTEGFNSFFHEHGDQDVVVLFHGTKSNSPLRHVEVSGINAAISFLDKAFLSFPDGLFKLTSTPQQCEKKNGSVMMKADFLFKGTKVMKLVSDKTEVMIISNPLQQLRRDNEEDDGNDSDELEEGEVSSHKAPSSPTISATTHDSNMSSKLPPDDDLMALAIDPKTRKVSSRHAPAVEIIQGVNERPEIIQTSGTLSMTINSYLKVSRIEFLY